MGSSRAYRLTTLTRRLSAGSSLLTAQAFLLACATLSCVTPSCSYARARDKGFPFTLPLTRRGGSSPGSLMVCVREYMLCYNETIRDVAAKLVRHMLVQKERGFIQRPTTWEKGELPSQRPSFFPVQAGKGREGRVFWWGFFPIQLSCQLLV